MLCFHFSIRLCHCFWFVVRQFTHYSFGNFVTLIIVITIPFHASASRFQFFLHNWILVVLLALEAKLRTKRRRNARIWWNFCEKLFFVPGIVSRVKATNWILYQSITYVGHSLLNQLNKNIFQIELNYHKSLVFVESNGMERKPKKL